MLHSGSCLWGKMQRVQSVDTVCRASGRISSISVCSVATPVPRVAASGRAALASDEVVAWPLSPSGSSSLVTPRQLPSLWLLCAHLCCCAEGVPVLTPFPAYACPVSRRSQRTFHHFCASKGRTSKST